MGKTITPKYRVVVTGNFATFNKALTPFAWEGPATPARLEEFRQSMNRSFNKGGANFHVSQADGFIYHISKATLIRQSDDKVICEAVAPLFEVVE